MIVKGNDVIGLKVLTITEGANVDNVEDIIYDPKENKVRALLVDKGGWFSDAKVIPIEAVKSIGEEAVMVESADAIKKASDVGENISHIAKDDTYLTKTRVVTESGNDLGHITDLYFDDHLGIVQDFEVSQGLRDLQSGKKRIKVTDIITVGEDATIVKSAAEDTIEQQANKQGMQGMFQNAKSSAPSVLDKAKEKVSQAAQATSQKAQELGQKAADKTQNLSTAAQQKTNDPDIQRHFQQTVDAAKEKAEKTKATVQQKVSDKKEEQNRMQKEALVGKYVTKNILNQSDALVAVRGDIITHDLLDEAERAGVSAQLSGNVSSEPVEPEALADFAPYDEAEDFRMFATLGGAKDDTKTKKKSTVKKKKTKPSEPKAMGDKGGEKK